MLTIRALAVLCWLAPAPLAAEYYPAVDGSEQAVTVYSSLDEALAQPIIDGFQKANPDLAVDYLELQTLEIHERIIAETGGGERTADLAFSSAMDLQLKLANDGYARVISGDFSMPPWSAWRNAAFGVTFEPAVIIYNKAAFPNDDPPRTRAALANYLRDDAANIRGRIGTYDIERSGAGFLFLARDAEHNRDIWDLVRAMGGAGVKLYSTSSAILERVGDGRFVLGYNILGSYAQNWAVNNPDIGIVMPEDYTVIMTRVALVPRAAANPQLGQRFLEYLLSRDGQEIFSTKTRIPALHPDVKGRETASSVQGLLGTRIRPVRVGPGLLVYLDQVKRERLIRAWNEALTAQ